MSRYGDFRGDDRQTDKPITLPLHVHAHGAKGGMLPVTPSGYAPDIAGTHHINDFLPITIQPL